MFDIGWTELLVIGIVALIVVGPKDLPVMFRTLGKFTAKLRAMAREFQRSMNEAADESGMRDVAADLRSMAKTPREMGLDAVKKAADFDLDELDDDPSDTGIKPSDTGIKSKSNSEPSEPAEARRGVETRTAETAKAAGDGASEGGST